MLIFSNYSSVSRMQRMEQTNW